MKIIVKWTIKCPLSVSAISIDPVHNRMIAGVGKQIILYDAVNGKELARCEKHTQDVSCLAFRKDGLLFASGGKDNLVFIWDINKLSKPINKITFQDPLIRMGYNPCLMILISMSKTSLSVCKEKTANRYPLNNTGVDFSWTNDGMKYAICYENGTVSIRDKEGDKDEKVININEEMNEKITCCCFSTKRFLHKEYVLYVCTWEKNFYVLDLFNSQVYETQKLTADPISISLYKEDYVIVGTNNREINFFSKEGIFITAITQGINSWVTCVRNFDKYSATIAAVNDGTIVSHQATFNTVHAIYREQYAYRKNLREIVIHNLISGEKEVIETKRYIKKMAIFKDLVAYLSNDKIIIHQLSDDDNTKPKYFVKWEDDLSLMLLASNHLIVCVDNRIVLFALVNDIALITNIEREWSFETDVKYLRVLGGSQKREGMLCGTKSGEVYIVYLDNQFPINIYSHELPVRSLDINFSRTRLGIIDDNFTLTMVDLESKTVIWNNEKAKSLAFNSDVENMVSFWYDGNVYIKTSDFPPIKEKTSGVIIGFRGTKVFVLQSYNTVSVLDISNSQSIMRFAEKKQMKEAYEIACLGATSQEWIFLAVESMLNFDFTVAANCFKKLKDIRFINLIVKLQQDRKDGINDEIIRGDIYAHIGKYKKAAELYIKGGNPGKAQEMYATLKMYAEAMEVRAKYMQGEDAEYTDEILRQQAEWLGENKKFKEAGDLYMAIGKKKTAIEIYGEHNFLDILIEICRNLTKDDDAELIKLCGFYFKKHHNYQYAAETYLKLGDEKALVYMNVELKRWDEAFILSRENKQLSEYVYLKYAEALILEDKFKEAQEAYRKADRIDLSMKLLNKLIENAVYEKRFKDACFFFISYTYNALGIINDYNLSPTKMTKLDYSKIKEYELSKDLTDLYNAFDYIYRYIEEPFNTDIIALNLQNLLNASAFSANKLGSIKNDFSHFKGISQPYIYYCLGLLAKDYEAFKTSRFAFEKLSNLKCPKTWDTKIEKEIIKIRTKPYVDSDEQKSECFNCNHQNALINQNGDVCSVCNAPFIRCSLSFEILPLVEFKPKNISDDFAIDAIKHGGVSKIKKDMIKGGAKQNNAGEYKLTIAQNEYEDVFEMKMKEYQNNSRCSDHYRPIELNESELKSLNESEVIIVDERNINKTYPVHFYKNRKKDCPITMCKFCHKFFKSEEFENAFLRLGECPLCKGVDEAMKVVRIENTDNEME